MKVTTLGRLGPSVSVVGLGCMGMSENYGPSNDAESREILARALDLGINFWDTADSYGPFHNEELIGKFLAGRRDKVIIASKFGFVRSADPTAPVIDNSPQYIRSACEGSLRRLQVEALDLYYVHRIDPVQPIEETVGAMAELVRTGKVRALGLSEVSAKTLRRAAAVHPIAALQSEYSLWERGVEREVLPACRELGVSFVAFSPLGRGFLTGTIANTDALAADDYRRQLPRFQGEAGARNRQLVDQLAQIASEQGCSAGQLALAWVLARGPDVIPIPGTRRLPRLEQNAAAADIVLTQATQARLDALFAHGAVAGARYDADGMRLVDQ